jgi:hypothetical protein
LRHRDARFAEQLLGLIFVDFHAGWIGLGTNLE